MNTERSADIRTKRIYEPAAAEDGVRLLVDRVWPRGLSKEQARLEHWLRELAPSTALRKWFAHDPQRWDGFRQHYLDELQENAPDDLDVLRRYLREGRTVTLLFASRETRMNNAVALKEFIDSGEL